MDFILFYSLLGALVQLLVFSYDIACQWSCNLRTRIPQLPATMQLPPLQITQARFVILKFHIYAHGLSCQSVFSLNFQCHMAETNGEDPERWWAHINLVSMSTKEMGPGAWLNTIDDHAAAWNWRKITHLCTYLSALHVINANLFPFRHRLIKATQKCDRYARETPRHLRIF
jgi:hypothetical protein